jgi:hypothetical protein
MSGSRATHGGRRGPSWGRETAVNNGQSRCPTDNQTYSSSAIIGRDRAAGPYMACKGSGVQIPSAPPQVNGLIRPRPSPNRPPRAADRQQLPLRRTIRRPPERQTVGGASWRRLAVESPQACHAAASRSRCVASSKPRISCSIRSLSSAPPIICRQGQCSNGRPCTTHIHMPTT